ncbi:glycosyltransferase family 4 protein [Macrococcus animalis]|uniref:glycosyltransferase family 4 protein n=1 Tax=Macrococcus animalis TaxID=3395467 RepID=UPI0039BEB60B
MNFLIINHYATTPYQNGGTRHYDRAKELIKLGHKVTIVASSFNHFSKKETQSFDNQLFTKENIDGIDFVWIKTIQYKNNIMRIPNILSFYFNSKKVLYKHDLLNERPDFIIGSTVHLLAAQVALELSKKMNAKFIFEERDLWPQTFIDFGKLKEKNIISKLLFKYEKYFYDKADKVIILFPKAKSYLMEKGVKEENIIVLPNGYSNNSNHVNNHNENIIDEALYNETLITYIGSHGIANELDKILDFAEVCEDLNVKFLFIGDGNEKHRLVNRVKQNNVKNIIFSDPINKNQVQQVLQKSKFTIISIKDSPLYKYGFSMNKLFDYLNADKPIFLLANKDMAKDFDFRGVNISLDLEYQKDILTNYLLDEKKYSEDCRSININKKKFSWEVIILDLIRRLEI